MYNNRKNIKKSSSKHKFVTNVKMIVHLELNNRSENIDVQKISVVQFSKIMMYKFKM